MFGVFLVLFVLGLVGLILVMRSSSSATIVSKMVVVVLTIVFAFLSGNAAYNLWIKPKTVAVVTDVNVSQPVVVEATAKVVKQPTVVKQEQVATATPVAVKIATTVPKEAETATPVVKKNLPKVQIGVISFAPYAQFVGAREFGEAWGVEIEIVMMTGGEESQCAWVKGELDPPELGVSRLLLTTHNSAYVCGDMKVVWVIGQSNGTDGLLVRLDSVKTLNDVFLYPVTGCGYGSVSEYFVKLIAWALQIEKIQWIPQEDAGPAKDAFIADPSIKTAALWEPHLSAGKIAVEGSDILLSTKSWAGIFDVVVMKSDEQFNENIARALGAYVQFLNLQMKNFDESWNLMYSQDDTFDMVGYAQDEKDFFEADLAGEAQATLKNNIALFLTSPEVLKTRFDEVSKVLSVYPPLDKDGRVKQITQVASDSYIDSRYVVWLREQASLETNDEPINPNIILSENIPLDKVGEQVTKKLIAQLADVYFEFIGGSTDFVSENSTKSLLNKVIVPITRLMPRDFVIELTGGYAMPTPCQGCTDEGGVSLALQRAEKVKQTLVNEYKIPANRIVVSQNVRSPEFRGTTDPVQAASDRRVQVRVYQIIGQ
jgi:hypothetical protein